MSRARSGRGLQRLALAAGTAWAILLVYAASSMQPWPDILFRTDFFSFWSAAAMIREGAGPALYDLGAQRVFQAELRMELATTEEMRAYQVFNPFPNPPPLGLVYVPLTLLPLPWGYALWFGLSLAVFLAAIALPLRGRTSGRSIAAMMLTFGGVTTTLLEGQPYSLMLLALGSAMLAMACGRPLLGGALLGLLWLKPQYAALFPLVFLAKGRWREMAGMAATGIAVAVTSLAMVGPEGLARYLVMTRQVGAIDFPGVHPQAMVNWRALLLNLWPGIPETSGSILVLALGTGTALLSLLVWRGHWDAASPSFPRQMLATVSAALIASPHSHFQGTVLLLAPLAMIAPIKGEHIAWAWRPLLAIGYLLAVVAALYTQLRWLMGPYLALAMGLQIMQRQRCQHKIGQEDYHLRQALRHEP